MIAAALLVLSAAWMQDPVEPAPRRRVRSEVRVLIEESPEGDYEHEYYEQPLPVEFRSGTARVGSGVWYRTVCRPQDEDRAPLFPPPPSAPATFTLPLSVSASVGAPKLRVSASPQTISTFTGKPRTDPGITPPGGQTKPALFGGADPESETSSDSPFLYGPDFDLVVLSDPVRWIPEGSAVHLYARALFGAVEVFDTPTSLQLFSVGPRLSVPIARSTTFEFSATLSVGPAFLRSGLGDAVGFDGGIGLRFEQVFSPGVSLVAAVEANLFFSQNVTAYGPAVNLGLNVSW